MNKINPNIIPHPFLTESELRAYLGGTPDSRYGKVRRLLTQGKLLHIRRGLYALTEEGGGVKKVHPYELAQFIYRPSYISLESALSYHELIPEAVRTVTSVCTKRSNEFHTPLGIFSFQTLPLLNFYMGVSLVHDGAYHFFMASPWKAICDYVYCYKKDWKNTDPLFESLRIEPGTLPPLTAEQAQDFDRYYQRNRVSRFLKGVV